MLDILHDYLVDATSPENVDSIERAHEAFDRIGLHHYENEFQEIIMISDERDEGDTLGSIIDLTKHLAGQILTQHSITVSDECTVTTRTEFINALMDLQQATDHITDILSICAQQNDPEELFAELVALVGTHEAEHYLVDLEIVSPMLITRIKELVDREILADDSVDQDRMNREERIMRFNHFMHFILDPDLAIMQIAHMGVDAGFPFEIYANLIGRDFEGMEPVVAAQNLIGMAFLSEDGFQNPTSIIKANIDQFVSDVDVITKIDIAVSDLLVRFQTYETA